MILFQNRLGLFLTNHQPINQRAVFLYLDATVLLFTRNTYNPEFIILR
jgi:hypothetical protein